MMPLLDSLSAPAARAALNGQTSSHLRDLQTARQVQQNLFPRRLPCVHGWDFAACCLPAQAVGGDYYDVFEARPGQLAIALGDVSGKGLGPALVMAYLHGLARSLLPSDPAGLGRFVAGLNNRLADSLPESWFVTLFVGIVDLAGGWLSYVSAGHPPALLLDGNHSAPVPLTVGGPALGAFPGQEYPLGQARLESGSLLAVFSDGLTEACNAGGEMFRTRRVAETLGALRGKPAEVVRVGLLQAVEHFSGGAGQTDDRTMLVVCHGEL
jgi:sigma-B regulation protein RsbU (phosphoserine phosphatase)